MPSIGKKKLLRKKYKKHFLINFKQTKSTQTKVSVYQFLQNELNKLKNELEILEIVDCLSGDCDSFSCNLVTFEIKSL